MKQFAKAVQAEIRKRVAEQIVAWIGLLLTGLSPTVKLWASHLSLSESQVSSIRYWMLFAGSIALISVAWLLFLRTFRKLQSVQLELADELSKKGVFAYLKPVKGKGYDIDTRTGEVVCPTCTTDEKAVPMRDNGHAYYCFVCGKGVLK